MSANDGADFSSPSSSFIPQQPVTQFTGSATRSEVSTDQSATSSTVEASNKTKAKKRQPKYRATKRPPSDRRFQCESCESRFFTQKDVKRHMVVHTGVRNFACQFCTQKFGRKDHLVRHAKKSHGKDMRSFKRRSRAPSTQSPPESSTESTKKARKSTTRSKRKAEESFAPLGSIMGPTASPATVSTTSLPTSYYLHENNGFSGANPRVAATSNPTFDNSAALLLSSTSTSLIQFPTTIKSLVEHPSTSTLTASLSHQRNYPSSFNNFEPSGSAFQYSTNGAFNQFLPDPSTQYPLPQMTPNSNYGNYEYKPATLGANYINLSQHDNFATSTGQSSSVTSTNNGSFKSLPSSIADGFNTCLDLDYNAAAGIPGFTSSISGIPFTDAGHTSRFPSPFN